GCAAASLPGAWEGAQEQGDCSAREMSGKEHRGQNWIGDEQPPCGGASTIRVKFQIAATNVLKLIKLAHLSHVDFHSGFATVFQGVHRVFTLPGDREEARAESTH